MTEPRWTDLAAAYALDALESDERAAFEEQLAVDPSLRALVDEYRGTLGALADSLPRATPPAGLKERVLDGARRARPSGSAEAAGPEPYGSGATEPFGAARGEDAGSADTVREIRQPWGGLRLALAASLAATVLLGSLAIMFALGSRGLERQVVALSDELETVRSELSESEAELARFDSIAAAFTGGDLRFASLTAPEVEPRLNLIMNREDGVLLVAAANLPPAPDDRTYQLWGISEGEDPVSLGVFDAGTDNTALQALELLPDLEFDLAAVTDEPDGGSPLPTTTPFLVGPWTAESS